MNNKDLAILQKTLSTGKFDGLSIRVVNTPRLLVTLGDKEFWLDSKDGLSNRKDFNPSYILERLRASFTRSDIGESFPFVAADRVSRESERRSLHLNLSEYGKDTYTGVLVAPSLEHHVAKDQDSNQSPESLIGIDTVARNRIIFNLVDSATCTDRDGFDRVMNGEFATVYLNSETGEYLAIKTEACKASYAPLAHLSAKDIDDIDLIKAMSLAPTEDVFTV